MACTLRFAAETVEMTELSEDPLQPRWHPRPLRNPPLRPPRSRPRSRSAPPTPADELLVIAALHRIGADLGEPVEVRREGPEVVVNVAGVEARSARRK